jgi:hypothetical protein
MAETATIASGFFGDALYQQRARQALPLLVRQAEAGTTIYYADLAQELGMPNPRNLNFVLGCVGNTLNDLSKSSGEEIPHIQAIVVNQHSDTPGDGFDGFLSDRGEKWKSEEERWAVLETYWARIKNYPHWGWVLEELGLSRANAGIDDLIDAAAGRGGGEGPEHAALKEYVRRHPTVIGLRADHPVGVSEYALPSGDSVDVVFRSVGRFDCVEVKPADCGAADVTRGLFQCVKYRAVVEAKARFEQVDCNVFSWLVLGGRLPAELVPLRNSLGITVFEDVVVS